MTEALPSLVVFDWDGTLVDSVGHIVTTMQRAMRASGLPERSEAAIRDIIGLGLDEAVARLYPDHAVSEVRDTLVEVYRREYTASGVDGSRLFAGVVGALDDLRGAGLRLAVATGKSRAGLDSVLPHTGVADRFVVTRCADEGFAKPHPDMLEHILAVTGTDPGQALMVGDSEHDMALARNAGVPAVAVTCGAHPDHVLHRHGPLACLDSVAALPAWLRKRGWLT